MLPPPLKPVAPSPTSSAMEFVSATAPQELTLIPRTEFARAAAATASVASPTPSATLAMLVMILTRVFASRLLLTVLLDNSDTMEFVTPPVLLVLANKAASARELALLELGPLGEDAIVLAQPS